MLKISHDCCLLTANLQLLSCYKRFYINEIFTVRLIWSSAVFINQLVVFRWPWLFISGLIILWESQCWWSWDPTPEYFTVNIIRDEPLRSLSQRCPLQELFIGRYYCFMVHTLDHHGRTCLTSKTSIKHPCLLLINGQSQCWCLTWSSWVDQFMREFFLAYFLAGPFHLFMRGGHDKPSKLLRQVASIITAPS